jgi:hypothetical protein
MRINIWEPVGWLWLLPGRIRVFLLMGSLKMIATPIYWFIIFREKTKKNRRWGNVYKSME